MVASADGELASRNRRALDRHLAHCPACRAEQVAAEGVLAALATLDHEADVPARLEQQVFREVRRIADEKPGAPARLWLKVWGLAPSVAAGAVAVLAVVALREIGPSTTPTPTPSAPRAVATARPQKRPQVARRGHVPADPPVDLASQPELFVDLPMLRHLEKLEHFDAIATMEGDTPTGPTDEPSPSNG
jgi:anti-sigma factor RsiW